MIEAHAVRTAEGSAGAIPRRDMGRTMEGSEPLRVCVPPTGGTINSAEGASTANFLAALFLIFRFFTF